MRTSKNRKIFSANNEQGTRIFTLGLHYSCIPSYNNIVKIFSNRPAVAGLIKKVQLSWTNQKVQLSWTNKKSPAVAISEAGFPFATRARKREPCLQRYVSRMTRTENFLSQFFSKFFWKPLLSPFYGTLFIISRTYFFGFSKSAPTPRYTNQKVQIQLD